MRGRNSKQPVHHEINLLAEAPTPLRLTLPRHEGVNIVLVGCGGTGSHLASGIGALASELRTRHNLEVGLVFVDPDHVEEKNCGRQLFMRSEIGKFKAHVLANRITAAYQIPVDARCEPITEALLSNAPREALNLIIGAVDNNAARRVMDKATRTGGGSIWWLDCGNENHSGQVVLGNAPVSGWFKGAVGLGMTTKVPALSLVHPEVMKEPEKRPIGRRDLRIAESCAELAASGEQGLMINRLVAAWALALLTDLVLGRSLKYFGLTFNAQTGGTRPYMFDLPTLMHVTGYTEKQLQGGKPT